MRKPFPFLVLALGILVGCKPDADVSPAPALAPTPPKQALSSGGGRIDPDPMYSTADQLLGSKLKKEK